MIYDICIIGGGASGLAAAVTAKRNGAGSVVILEKKDSLGQKIIASGNRRCNLSNVRCETWEDTRKFFLSMGLVTRINEAGLCYPHSEDSFSVVKAFEAEIEKLGVEVRLSSEVSWLTYDNNKFTISGEAFEIQAFKVLLAAGGKSAPKLGTTGDGARLAKSMGHKVTPLIPVLTGVITKENMSPIAGIREKGKVSLLFDGKEIFSEEGEIQFNREGVSGICVFNLSRYMMIPEGATLKNGFDRYEISMDFVPELSYEEVVDVLKSSPAKSLEDKMNGLIKPKLAALIGDGATEISQLALRLKDFRVHPKGARGWDSAQVTRGGVELSEVNMETMESKLVKGLFFAGEVLNFDGPCGGFNLNFAWETGMKSGRGMTIV